MALVLFFTPMAMFGNSYDSLVCSTLLLHEYFVLLLNWTHSYIEAIQSVKPFYRLLIVKTKLRMLSFLISCLV